MKEGEKGGGDEMCWCVKWGGHVVSFITTQPWPMFHLCGTSFFTYYSIRVNDRVEQLAVSVYVSFVAMFSVKTKPTCITSDKYRKKITFIL